MNAITDAMGGSGEYTWEVANTADEARRQEKTKRIQTASKIVNIFSKIPIIGSWFAPAKAPLEIGAQGSVMVDESQQRRSSIAGSNDPSGIETDEGAMRVASQGKLATQASASFLVDGIGTVRNAVTGQIRTDVRLARQQAADNRTMAGAYNRDAAAQGIPRSAQEQHGGEQRQPRSAEKKDSSIIRDVIEGLRRLIKN